LIAGTLSILAVGASARLSSWGEVFTENGLRLVVDTDPHYHVLRAERLLKGDANGAWFDRNMNHPTGAEILWPPGFDMVIAQAARWTVGGEPSRDAVARVAAFVPVVLGCVVLMLLVVAGRKWLGPGAGLAAGALAAILPVHVEYGLLGRPDQHVAELLVFLSILITFERSARTGGRVPSCNALFGMALGLGPWIWQGATLYLAFVTLAATVMYVMRGEGDEGSAWFRALGWGTLVAGVALTLSILVARPSQLMRDSLTGLAGFQPASMIAVSVFAGVVLALERARRPRTHLGRAAAVTVAGMAPLAALALVFAGAIGHGLRSLTAGDPWLRAINEFQPALFGSRSSLGSDLLWFAWGGPVWLAPFAAVPAIRRLWIAEEGRRAPVAFLGFGTALFLGLSLYSKRFQLYLAPFLALWAGLILSDLLGRAKAEKRARFRRVASACAALLLFASPAALFAVTTFASDVSEGVIAMLRWMKAQPPAGERRSVLASWTMGHAIQYYADLPVTVTPFGTDLGQDGMRDQAAFYFAESLEEAEEVARRRQVRYVILGSLLSEYNNAFAFAPRGARPFAAATHDYWGRGRTLTMLPAADFSIPLWLYEYDGVPLQMGYTEGAGSFRLVYETPGGRPLKVFEAVEGARVRIEHAQPLTEVTVSIDVVTNQGRSLRWGTSGRTDASGTVTLRVPYADGINGAVQVAGCSVRIAGRALPLSLSSAAVQEGRTVTIDVGRSVPASPSTGSGKP
jgi:dolichyl-diphosphooligosaccharide--protein glycosyltransferase